MNTDEPWKILAWQPLTPPGVAKFADASLGRLLLVQTIVALLAAAAIAWFFGDSYFPAIRTAIRNLPDTGKISSGKLDWHGDSPRLLAAGKFLALDVDLSHSGGMHSTADVQIEFGGKTVRISSLLGYVEFPYPPGRFAPFNRTQLDPFWGAWSVEILFAAFVATALALLLSWRILATVYFLPAWLLGFYTNRDLNLRESWKLCGAALLPGALLMTAGIWLYDFGALDLVQFGFVFCAHLVLGWIYLFSSLLFLPRIDSSLPKANPFSRRN